MILNVNAYNSLFPTVRLDNIQINTWYLAKDITGYFKCNNVTVELICDVIDFINNQNKITEISMVISSGKNYRYHLIYNSKDKNSIINKNKLKENADVLATVDLTMKNLLKVYDAKGVIVDEYFDNSTVIHFSLKDNTIDIMMDYGSIFNQDNRLCLTLIYLYHTGLVKKGSKNVIDELNTMLKKDLDMDSIIGNLMLNGGIILSDDTYQYIENCVAVFNENYFISFKENHVLSDVNKSKLKGFVSGLEKIIGVEFNYIETDQYLLGLQNGEKN